MLMAIAYIHYQKANIQIISVKFFMSITQSKVMYCQSLRSW